MVRRNPKDFQNFLIEHELIPPEGLKILPGEAAVCLLLLLDGQNGNAAFGPVAAGFQKGLHPLPPAEAGVCHQLPGIVQQPGLLVAQGVEYQLLLGGEKAVKEGLGNPHFLAQGLDAAVDQPPLHDALDHRDHQGLSDLFPLLSGIRFSCHGQSPSRIKYKI